MNTKQKEFLQRLGFPAEYLLDDNYKPGKCTKPNCRCVETAEIKNGGNAVKNSQCLAKQEPEQLKSELIKQPTKMSQTTPTIEVKTAFHVTKDAITETSAFTFDESGNYSSSTPTETTYYLTPKGWVKSVIYSWEGESGKNLVYSSEEATELKRLKMLAYIDALTKQSEDAANQAKKLKSEL